MTIDNRPLAELADEYVIGLCDPAEAAAIERRLEIEPDLAVLIEQARQRFAELDATAQPEPVPEALWSQVLAEIEDADAGHATGEVAAPVVDLAARRATRARRSLVWTTAASLAASLVLAIALGWNLLSVVEPKVVAVLVNTEGQPVAMIEGGENNATLVTMLGDTDVPAGQVLQLWTKPDPDGPPVSIGVFDEPRQTRLSAPSLPSPTADQLYEITFEQPGGSPTGLPTGPILGKGFTKLPN